MPASLSVIIPTLNAAKQLPRSLPSLIEGLDAGLIAELIVADGGSSDQTVAIAKAAGAVVVTAEAGRGVQLRTGAINAKGRWLLFLHADTALSTGWADHVSAHLANEQRAYYFRLKFDAQGFFARMTAGWANLRSAWIKLPYGDQGLLISRALYDEIGGYTPMVLMEDVEISRRLRKHLTPLKAVATTGADKYLAYGWLVQGTRNFLMLARYLTGTSPEILAKSYPTAQK